MDPITLGALLQGGGALFGAIAPHLAQRKTQRNLAPIEGYGRQAYNPFIQQGQQAENQLFPFYSQIAQNPQDYYNQLLGGYEPSQGFQYRKNLLNREMANTAASGGFRGTEGHQMRQAEQLNQLLGGDIQDYLNNIFRIQGAGIEGLEGRTKRGYESAGNLADYLGTAASERANAGAFYAPQQAKGTQSAMQQLASLIGGPQSNLEGSLGNIFKRQPTTQNQPLRNVAPWSASNVNLNQPFLGGF